MMDRTWSLGKEQGGWRGLRLQLELGQQRHDLGGQELDVQGTPKADRGWRVMVRGSEAGVVVSW